MNAKIIRMMFWMGLLVLLLGRNSPTLMAQGGGIPPTDPPLRSAMARSLDLIAQGPGIPPTGGPQGAISFVS
jgi:hypothetical protein